MSYDHNDYSKKRYEALKLLHRCPSCEAKLPRSYNYVYCEQCRKIKMCYNDTRKPRFFKEKLDKGGL